MKVERKDQINKTITYVAEKTGSALLMTPPINDGYWKYRVHLSQDQYILAFPKFGTIGIGFAQEEDWNTNLPYTCDAEIIMNHIWHNHKYDEITQTQVIEAIELTQSAIREDEK